MALAKGSVASKTRHRLRSPVVRTTVATVGVSFVTQGFLLITGPISARLLGVTNRGYLALFTLVGLIVSLLGTAGMPLAVTYWIARTPTSDRAVVSAMRSVVAVQIAACVVCQAAILLVLVGSAHANVLLAAVLSLVQMPALLLLRYTLAVLQGQARMRAFNVVRFLGPVLTTGALIIVALTTSGGLLNVTAAYGVATAALAILAVVATFTRHRAAQSVSSDTSVSRKAMLRFGISGLLGDVTPVDAFNLDQLLVGLFLSPRALGYYVVAVAFTNLPRFVGQSMGFVAFPHIAHLSPEDARRSTIRFVTVTLLCCVAIGAAVELALPWVIPHLYGAAFSPSVRIGRIVMISGVLVGLRKILSDCARGAGRPGLGSEAEVVALVSLFAAAAALGSGGARGIAEALVISSALSVLPLMRILLPRRSGAAA